MPFIAAHAVVGAVYVVCYIVDEYALPETATICNGLISVHGGSELLP